jgi:hypothetical protein
MSHIFTIDVGSLDDEQLQGLRALGCRMQIQSSDMNDEQFIRLQWLLKYKTPLNLSAPATFSEKMHWLKLHYRKRTMPPVVDKLAVRDFVVDRVGSDCLNALHASGPRLEDIDVASLPPAFIVKCTHGCDFNIVVTNRQAVDWPAIVERIDRWLNINYYDMRREWVYKHIPPRVVVEQLLVTSDPRGLLDYKVYCFHGRARFIQVDLNRQTNHLRNLYDLDWRRLPCELHYPGGGDVERPPNYDAMIELAERLSTGFPFVRVDMFNLQGRIVFGEMTFYPGNGFIAFTPERFDRMFGDYLELPDACDDYA